MEEQNMTKITKIYTFDFLRSMNRDGFKRNFSVNLSLENTDEEISNIELPEENIEICNLILFDDYQRLWNDPRTFLMKKEDFQYLLNNNYIETKNLTSLYEMNYKEKIITLALREKQECNFVYVYTKDEDLAIDLILNGITVKNTDLSDHFENTVLHNSDKDLVYYYDTCILMEHLKEIDFSNNTHIIPSCVLEELLSSKDCRKDDSIFFMFVYVYNKYKRNIKILHTQSFSQGGGKYSSTDLLILYTAIRYVTENSADNFIFLTQDNQLYLEATLQNQFRVSNKIDSDLEYTEENDTDSNENQNNHIDTYDYSNETDEERNERIRCVTHNYTMLPLSKFYYFPVLNVDFIHRVFTRNNMLVKPLENSKGKKYNRYAVKPGYFITFKDNTQTRYMILSFKDKTATIARI